jgi:hypothetical protein
MSEDIDAALEATFFAIADVLIPDYEEMPSASRAQDAGPIFRRVLALRPDLREDFLRGLRAVAGRQPEPSARDLQKSDPAAYVAIGTIAAAGYYMSPGVRALIGYPGQEKRAFDPDATPEYVSNGMLRAVADRGPIYRPTPGPADANSVTRRGDRATSPECLPAGRHSPPGNGVSIPCI